MSHKSPKLASLLIVGTLKLSRKSSLLNKKSQKIIFVSDKKERQMMARVLAFKPMPLAPVALGKQSVTHHYRVMCC